MENPDEPDNSNVENREARSNEDDDDLSLSLLPYPERCMKATPIDPSLLPQPSPIVFSIPLHVPAPAPAPVPVPTHVYVHAHSSSPPVPNVSLATGAIDGALEHNGPISDEGQPDDGDDNDEIIIDPPFPWATNRPAKVHTLQYLVENNILAITGDVECGSCHRKFEMSFDLVTKICELVKFMGDRRATMDNRAPEEWKHPVLPRCEHCGVENSVKPIIGNIEDHSINWLFLFLGKLLGLCTLKHLRYFCQQTKNHRSGSKEHVLYYTYTQLMKQLKGNS